MHLRPLLLSTLVVLAVAGEASAADLTVQRGPGRTSLLELFASEGCSSCPPAENWFSDLRQNPRLWKDFVPVSFHINYWDDLGWTDALATPAFTERQRSYASAWGAGNVYTPEFVLNGAEWRVRDVAAIPAAKMEVGKLSASMGENGAVRITFQPAGGGKGEWEAHAALLGFGVTSDVRAGENSGRRLVHDFVVLALQNSPMRGGTPAASLQLPADKAKQGQSALAVWVTRPGSLEPVQAAGGEL